MGMSKEQEELILTNLNLVHYLVKKLNIRSYSDYEDMVSIGTIGLIKAAQTFNTSKKIKFSTYASKCIKNEIFMYFRREKMHKNKIISLDTIVSIDKEGNEMTLREKIQNSDKDFTEKLEEKEMFIKTINIILNGLRTKERFVVLQKIAGERQRTIAKILNVSEGYISRIQKEAYNKIKTYLISRKHFKEIFYMEIIDDDLYQISFDTKDIPYANKNFVILIQKLDSKKEDKLLDFKIVDTKIAIFLLADLSSFSLVANIIKEFDNGI